MKQNIIATTSRTFRGLMMLLVMLLAVTARAEVTGNWVDYRAASLTESADHDTIYISTAEELALYAYNVNHDIKNAKGYYCARTIELLADIDLGAHDWTPIATGTSDVYFNGTFHGNGHVIRNMTRENYTEGSFGFFGIVQGALSGETPREISGLTFVNSYVGEYTGTEVTSSGCLIGLFFGKLYNIKDILIVSPQYGTNAFYGDIVSSWGTNTAQPSFTNCYVYDSTQPAFGGGVSPSGVATAHKLTLSGATIVNAGNTGVVCDGAMYAAEGEELSLSTKEYSAFLIQGGAPSVEVSTYTMGSADATLSVTAVPYEIRGTDDMVNFRNRVNDGYCKDEALLFHDIDLGSLSENWIPIGTASSPFMGKFDGQGYSIYDMHIEDYTTDYQGLFGRVAGTHPGGHAQLKNFTISGNMTSSTSGLKYIAGVVGQCDYVADLENVTNNVNITLAEGTTQSYIGGVTGFGNRAKMQCCVNNGNINAGDSWECIGGLQAYARGYSSTVNCLNTGCLTSTADNAYMGGMFGYQADSRFQGAVNCLNTSIISGGTQNINAGAIYGLYNSSVAVSRKGSNNYYLSVATDKGVGNNAYEVDDLTDVCTPVSIAQITSGEVCYLLNGSTSEGTLTWYQRLGEDGDSFPVFHAASDNSNTVYRVDYTTCRGEVVDAYSNTTAPIVETHIMTAREATNNTCVQAGHEAFWQCSRPCCAGIFYKDAQGSAVWESYPYSPALGHSLTAYTAIPADDTHEGRSAYWTCSRSCCAGIFYKDDQGSDKWDNYPLTPARLDVAADGTFSVADLTSLTDVLAHDGQRNGYTYTTDDRAAIHDIVLGKTFVQGNNQIVYYADSQVTLQSGNVNGTTAQIISHTFKDGMGVVTFNVGREGIVSASNMFRASGITKIIFPNSMTEVGEYLCYLCECLTEVVLPKSLKKIEKYAFGGCSHLTKVTLPETLTSIGEYSFIACRRLPAITIPASVSTLSRACFDNCYSCDITILSTQIKTLPQYCFSNVKNVKVPQGVKRIELAALQFYNARNTTKAKLEIPEGVTHISFIYMVNVEEITFPSTFTTIPCSALFTAVPAAQTASPLFDPVTGEEVVYDIPESEQTTLKVLNIKAVTPPVFDTTDPHNFTTNASALDEMTIYVPTGSVDAYKAAEGWSMFADQIQGKDF